MRRGIVEFDGLNSTVAFWPIAVVHLAPAIRRIVAKSSLLYVESQGGHLVLRRAVAHLPNGNLQPTGSIF